MGAESADCVLKFLDILFLIFARQERASQMLAWL